MPVNLITKLLQRHTVYEQNWVLGEGGGHTPDESRGLKESEGVRKRRGKGIDLTTVLRPTEDVGPSKFIDRQECKRRTRATVANPQDL